jgi:DNA-3-methyladenine glycosylase II
MPSVSSQADRWSEAVQHLSGVDAAWMARIDRVGPCLLRPRRDRFAMLVQAIIGQQISSKAATSIERRLRALGGSPHDPVRIAALGEPALRTVGLSTMKARYILELAGAVATGRLPLHQAGRWSDGVVIERLTKIKGIGRWTADMFLIFALNRPDILPVGDLGARAGIQRHYELPETPDAQACHRLTEPWRPFRSIATWYLWAEVDRAPVVTRS